MTHILLSLVGRAQKKSTAEGYPEATYEFAPGVIERNAFFGFAAARRLQPDRVILIGTPGSMWHFLLEVTGSYEQNLPLWETLEAASREDRTTQAMLDQLAVALTSVLGVNYEAMLSPYGMNQTEQLAILQALAVRIPRGATVSLDVTHGLRHLPIVMLSSTFFLQAAREAKVDTIYYGALERTDRNTGNTPVMRLDGLLRINQWLDALRVFDHTGDYSVFTRLLNLDEMPTHTTDLLTQASFLENILQVGEARSNLRQFRDHMGKEMTGLSALFQPALMERLAWVDGGLGYQRQQQLALNALSNRDFVRAALMGVEAVTTELCYVKKVPSDHFSERETVQEDYRKLARKRHTPFDDAFMELNWLRNALAHGERPRQKTAQQSLAGPDQLAEELAALFDILFAPDNPWFDEDIETRRNRGRHRPRDQHKTKFNAEIKSDLNPNTLPRSEPAQTAPPITYFISRHPGAAQWAAEQGLLVDHLVSHWNVAETKPGDVIIGTLPVHLAGKVCALGGRYFHLSLTMPEEMRGKELTAENMRHYGAELHEFHVLAK